MDMKHGDRMKCTDMREDGEYRLCPIPLPCDLDTCAQVIRRSFATVAKSLGLNESTCPGHPAFLHVDKLRGMKDRGARFFGAYAADRLVGFVSAADKGDTGYIEKLGVLPVYRHCGLGRRLMDTAMAYAKERGCTKISIGIVDENEVLKNWYRHMGFAVRETRTYAHLPFAVCMMERVID